MPIIIDDDILIHTIKLSPEEMIEYMKYYALSLIDRYVLHSVQNHINLLKKVFFTEFSILEINIEQYHMVTCFCDFINFSLNERDSVISKLYVKPKNNDKKKLKNYYQYLIWEDAISKVWENGSIEERLQFFPLLFLFSVGFLIPMRPTEICLTTFDCVSLNDENQFIIKLRKTKLKSSARKRVEYNLNDYYSITFGISDEIAGKIKQYQSLTQDIPREFLFLPIREGSDTFKNNTFNSNDLRSLKKCSTISI